MRALFIDFDGVLHRVGGGLPNSSNRFVWLPMLAKALADHPDVIVVVHSTWRYMYTLCELGELLSGLGVNSVTAAPRGQRAEAIASFLCMNPSITRHRILDDDLSEFSPAPEELLLCDPDMGLTTPGVLPRLIAWLDTTKAATVRRPGAS